MVYRRKGREGWWFHVADPATGRQLQVKAKQRLKRKAELEAAEYKSQLRKQFVPISSDDFGEFIHKHFWPGQMNHLTPKAMIRERGILDKHLGPHFAGPMRLIDRAALIGYIGKRQEQKASRETIRKELNTLKHALRIACKPAIGLLARNPFDDLERKDWPAPGEKRTRHLVGDEWQRLMAKLPVEKRPAVILLVNSGMRRGELFGLEWSDLNFKTGMAHVAKTKGGTRTGRGRLVKLTAEMVALLKHMPKLAGNEKVLWQFSANALSVAFRRGVKAAGLHNLRMHDLRHTFATEVRRAGAGIDVIAQLLGHSDIRQSQIYAHIGQKALDKAARSIEGKFSDEGEQVH